MTEKLTPAQARRVEAALPDVARLAKHLARRIPHAIEDDLIGAGREGLVQAALRYDAASGIPFGAFAHHRMKGAMIDAARRDGPEVRRRNRAVRTLHATQALLERAQAQQPSANDVDPRSLAQRVAAAAELVAQTTTAVLLARNAPPDPDEVPTDSGGMEAVLLDRERRRLLDAELAALAEDERALIVALYYEGLTMREYAERAALSVSTVSRHHAKLVQRIGSNLTRQLGG